MIRLCSVLSLSIAAAVLVGCGGSGKTPAGPDNVPVFNLNAQPPVIAPQGAAILSLIPTIPLDFEQLEGEVVVFSNEPDSGIFFDQPYSWVDLGAATRLNPEVWYQYIGSGSEDTLDVILYAFVVSQAADTLAWDSCLVSVVRD